MTSNATVDRVIDQLQSWFEEAVPVDEFLGGMDGLRNTLFDLFMSNYGDAYYAKLLYLKVSNYLVARYHYDRRHVHLASRPVTVMMDPSNACPLKCPGCVHSSNKYFVRNLRWPSGTMRTRAFEQLLSAHGPFALNTVLYNYGEPLLNKKLPGFIRTAHGYGMTTTLSTNLSIPFDIEGFVRSEPEHVVLSIDGVTQETYGRFRKRGRLDLVMKNVRELIHAKQRLGLKHPVLVWKFLVFAHNAHEVEDAVELARSTGVDRIWLQRPFDVSNDDPEVQLTEFKDRIIEFSDVKPNERDPERILNKLVRHDAVERFFDEGWLQRLSKPGFEEPDYGEGSSCAWLYYSVTADATGRVMPCCMSPSSLKHLIYGSLDEPQGNWLSAPAFAASRASFADREAFEQAANEFDSFSQPHCVQCPKPLKMTFDTNAGIANLRNLDHKSVLLGHKRNFWLRAARWNEKIVPERPVGKLRHKFSDRFSSLRRILSGGATKSWLPFEKRSSNIPALLARNLRFTRSKSGGGRRDTTFRALLSAMRDETAYMQNETAYLATAEAHKQNRDWKQALDALDAGLSAFPDSVTLLRLKGNVLVAAERFVEAGEVFDLLASRHPYEPAGFEGLATVATRKRQWAKASSRWDTCIDEFPKNAARLEWRIKKANVLLELRDYEAAEAKFAALVSEAPNRPAGHVGLARAAQGREEWKLAAERWRDCIYRFAENPLTSTWRESLAHTLKKQHENAEMR